MSTENNKLIAEFMGYSQPHPKYPTTTYWYKKDFPPLTVLLWDTSWDWLMEVVEKIEKDERYDVDILQHGTRITDNQKEIVNNIADISFDKKIEHTYDAVVEFIKNTEYKSCDRCCYDIVDDDGDIMEHICINNNFYSKPINK